MSLLSGLLRKPSRAVLRGGDGGNVISSPGERSREAPGLSGDDKAVESIVYILFDLDGTLTDPREGIVQSLKYALQALGYPSPSDKQFEGYIGPPLQESFAALLPSSDAEQIGRAVSLYRRRFTAVGMFENAVYPGIENALATLQEQSVSLYVVTSKPTVFAKQILDHFGLSRSFQNTYGSELDGTRSNKEELIAYVLAAESISAGSTVMVGDREHDVRGAITNGVTPLGVLWGYGSRQELTGAGAVLLCERPESLVEVLSSNPPLERTLLTRHRSSPRR
jgi:phosphoglycolate phosphatase